MTQQVERPQMHTFYHCNDSDKIDSYLDKEDLSILESVGPQNHDFLGNGVYFWDNEGNVEFWDRDRRRKNDRISLSKIEATASFLSKEMVDLTDESLRLKYEKAIELIKEMKNKRFERRHGILIDYLCDILNYKVVKVISKDDTIKAPDLLQSSRLNYKTRVIWCIKKKGYSDVIRDGRKI